MTAVSAIAPMDILGPALCGGLFIAIMSLVPHPARRSFNAIFAAGAVGAYIGGAFGVWELAFPILATPVVYLGLRSYRAIGLAWFMHAAWDLPHHLVGHPIWPYMRTSSLGCIVFDSVIALWFLAGAPSIFRRDATRRERVLRPELARTDAAATAIPAPSFEQPCSVQGAYASSRPE